MSQSIASIILAQIESALAMLKQCLNACPEEHWHGKIANDSFRQIAYHTLFFCDYYFSTNENAFQLRPCHDIGGDERSNTEASCGLDKADALAYLDVCHDKLLSTMTTETAESLSGESGFTLLPFSRAELHLYNLRHIQHHTGQLSAYLRRVAPNANLRWVKSGWQEPA